MTLQGHVAIRTIKFIIYSIMSRCKATIMCISCIKFVYDMSNMKKNSKHPSHSQNANENII